MVRLHPNTKTAIKLISGTLVTVFAAVLVMNFMPTQQDESIVFMRLIGNDMDIVTIDEDGTNERVLTNNDFEDWAPVWTVDKEQILFHSNRDGAYGIYIMDKDGSDVERLTAMDTYAMFPSVSPNGNQIAFEMYTNQTQSWDIYVMNLDGSALRRMTYTPAYDGGASWSPDGSQIAFHSTQAGYYDIYVMNANGSNLRRMTFYPETMDVWPVFSPDGDSIIFHSERDGDSEIFIMNSNGTMQTNLTNNTALDRVPRFSEDGKNIVFRSERNGDSEIFIMNLDGSNVRALTDNNARDMHPDW